MLKCQHVVTGSQKNQPEHESDDHASDRVTSMSVTNEKDMAL